MATRTQLIALCAGVVLVGAAILAIRSNHPHVIVHAAERSRVVKPNLPSYIAAHASDPDPLVQDNVGESRLHLAFQEANESWKTPKDAAKKVAAFAKARKTFLTVTKQPKGTGIMDPDFGGIPDQADYQAAVCLVAEGKSAEAKAEFIGFMKMRPLSPLCKACRDRLVRLNGGKSTAEYDALLQTSVSAQEKVIKFELSMCGPKAIEAVLPLLGRPKQVYQSLAKLCGTTDSGTTVEGMRKGLKTLGIQSYGFELNAADFAKLQAPALLLRTGHYLVMTKRTNKKAELYDPTTKRTSSVDLPKPDDADFTATVITFDVPTLGNN